MHGLMRSAKGAMRVAAGFVWPERSILTGARHGGHGTVSAEDFARLHFLNGQGCRACAAPVEIDLGDESLCGACAGQMPAWDAARAALAYDEASRQAILEQKHTGRRDGLATLVSWMTLAGGEMVTNSDVLIGVPLHYRRLAKRGYNQAIWLAQGIGAQAGKPVLVDTLVRHKATPSQAALSPRQRQKNVAGAFKVRARRAQKIAGKRVVLVDDVYTTGATLRACTLALKRAGAETVNVLVLARVVRDTDVTI